MAAGPGVASLACADCQSMVGAASQDSVTTGHNGHLHCQQSSSHSVSRWVGGVGQSFSTDDSAGKFISSSVEFRIIIPQSVWYSIYLPRQSGEVPVTNFKHAHLSFFYQVLIQRRLQQHNFIDLWYLMSRDFRVETWDWVRQSGFYINIFLIFSSRKSHQNDKNWAAHRQELIPGYLNHILLQFSID